MITHYDMITGEVLADDDQPITAGRKRETDRAVVEHLVAVAESMMADRCDRPMPADVADLPVERFIARFR